MDFFYKLLHGLQLVLLMGLFWQGLNFLMLWVTNSPVWPFPRVWQGLIARFYIYTNGTAITWFNLRSNVCCWVSF